jgi:predicted Na+-dependent transporter
MAFSPVSHVIFCALVTYFCLGYVLGYVIMDGIIEKKTCNCNQFHSNIP